MDAISFINEDDFCQHTCYYDTGFESTLYRYIHKESELLIKKYHDTNQVNMDKIRGVHSLKTEGLIKPQAFLKIGDFVEGFCMEFKRGCYPLSNQKSFLNNSQKYNILMNIKQILFSLKEEGCLYGDLNINNILTDGDRVYLCDSVNVQMDNYSFDEISSTMRKYIERVGTTEGIDIYMLNLLTIYLLNDIEYDSIVENIEIAVMNMFNKQPLDSIIGVTDSMENLDMCCDIFLSNRVCDKLLIDYIDFNMIDDKNKTPRI